jgi:hypothetical protein
MSTFVLSAFPKIAEIVQAQLKKNWNGCENVWRNTGGISQPMEGVYRGIVIGGEKKHENE